MNTSLDKLRKCQVAILKNKITRFFKLVTVSRHQSEMDYFCWTRVEPFLTYLVDVGQRRTERGSDLDLTRYFQIFYQKQQNFLLD